MCCTLDLAKENFQKMIRILIPTDFSETSMNAIQYAVELFKYEKSEFIIMNAYADEVYDNTREMSKEDFEAFKDAYKRNVDRSLQKEVASMLEISPNPRHTYNYRSRFGSLVDEANDMVEEENMDIIVMGTKGKTDDKNITFGSNTLQVIKYVKCPVLAVPTGYHGNHLENILFPTNYMIPFKRRELKLVSTIARRFVANIHFMHVSKFEYLSHRQQDNKELLTIFCKDNKCSFSKTPEESITYAINKTIIEKQIDMLVMVHERHSYLENILYRSTIEKIGLEINIPFLVLQNLQR